MIVLKFISGQNKTVAFLVKIISLYSQLSSDECNSEPSTSMSLGVEKEKFNEHLLNYFAEYRMRLLE